jgi:hypothetical protein
MSACELWFSAFDCVPSLAVWQQRSPQDRIRRCVIDATLRTLEYAGVVRAR